MPTFHILIFLLLNFNFSDNKEVFTELAQVSHELRLMPLPYGLLPHEFIEIVDNEKILPGISHLYKLGEDFPYLNNYNFQNIEAADNVNWHQRALLWDPDPTKTSGNAPMWKMIQKYKLKATETDTLLTFKDFHNIRYTFV